MPHRVLLRVPLALALCIVTAGPSRSGEDRPHAATLPVPIGATREQVLLGDRIFHGEAAGGRCSVCHGADAKGTGNGNDLTSGLRIWTDGSLKMIKARIDNSVAIAPGLDGDLGPADVDAVAKYVWAISRRPNY